MWALELYQVGQVAEAEKHTTVAEEHAMRAMTEASGPKAEVWRLSASLFAACARADRQDPAGAAEDIPRFLATLQEHGVQQGTRSNCCADRSTPSRSAGPGGRVRRCVSSRRR